MNNDLISRSELKKAINEFFDNHFKGLVSNELITYAKAVDNAIDNAPSVAESCKELHEVATERPQTIGCFNCKHETKMVCEEPCMVCNSQYSEWRQKE